MKIEQYIEKLRSEKNKPGTPGFFLYSNLSTAHPTVLEFMEYQAAQILMAGEIMNSSLEKSLSTEGGQQELKEMMLRAAQIYKQDVSRFEEDNDG